MASFTDKTSVMSLSNICHWGRGKQRARFTFKPNIKHVPERVHSPISEMTACRTALSYTVLSAVLPGINGVVTAHWNPAAWHVEKWPEDHWEWVFESVIICALAKRAYPCARCSERSVALTETGVFLFVFVFKVSLLRPVDLDNVDVLFWMFWRSLKWGECRVLF